MSVKLKIFEKLKIILSNFILCDDCLGRQFAKLLTFSNNKRRGEILREYFAFLIDAQNINETNNIIKTNLSRFKFNTKNINIITNDFHCQICNDLFSYSRFNETIKQILKTIRKIDFDTFAVSIHLNNELIEKEDALWDACGIEWCETIKSHLSRNIGIEIQKKLKKQVDLQKPDLNILLDFQTNKLMTFTKPIYIKGNCSKFKKIPILKDLKDDSKTGKAKKNSVQEIIEKPIIKKTFGTNSKFHTIGYESSDFLFSGKRNFVIEIKNPKKRIFDLKQIESKINKSKATKVFDLEFSDRNYMIKLKSKKFQKKCNIKIETKNNRYFKKIIDILNQNNIKISGKKISKNKIELTTNGFTNKLKELNYINKLDIDIIDFVVEIA